MGDYLAEQRMIEDNERRMTDQLKEQETLESQANTIKELEEKLEIAKEALDKYKNMSSNVQNIEMSAREALEKLK